MQKNLLKTCARQLPCVLLIALAIGTHLNSRKLRASTDDLILQTARKNTATFKAQIDAKHTRVRESFGALTDSQSFMDAWNQTDAINLLHEINSISRFLERIGASEQVVLINRAGETVVNMSSLDTRLPNALGERPGKGNPIRLTESGDLFLFTPVVFNADTQAGALQIWQSVDPSSFASSSANDIWAHTALGMNPESKTLSGTLLFPPANGDADTWSVEIERRKINGTKCLIFEKDGKIYAGATLTAISLYPSTKTSGLVCLTDLTSAIAPINAASDKLAHLSLGLLLLAIAVGVLLNRPAKMIDRTDELDAAAVTVAELKTLLETANIALENAHQEQNHQLSKIQTLEQNIETARQDVRQQEQLFIQQNDGSALAQEENEELKKRNAEMESRIMSLQQSYMTSLEEFQVYREEYELQQMDLKPTGPMPPQMEFPMGGIEPTRPQKEVELPAIVNRMQERLVARTSLPAPFSLERIFTMAIVDQQREAQDSGLTIEFAQQPNTPEEVAGDPIAFELIFANLLRFNTQGTSDGNVKIELSLFAKPNNEYDLIIELTNTGRSRSLHPWTDWIANPHQADCHENEIAAEWCSELITRQGGSFDPLDSDEEMGFLLTLPIQLTRSLSQEGAAELPDFFAELPDVRRA